MAGPGRMPLEDSVMLCPLRLHCPYAGGGARVRARAPANITVCVLVHASTGGTAAVGLNRLRGSGGHHEEWVEGSEWAEGAACELVARQTDVQRCP
jgi:hypothetical protein